MRVSARVTWAVILLILTMALALPVAAHAQSIFGSVVRIPPINIFSVVSSPSFEPSMYFSNGVLFTSYLPPNGYDGSGLNVTRPSYIYFSAWSELPITFYIFNNQEFETFITSRNVSGYLYSESGTNITGYYYVNEPGMYYVVVYNPGTRSVYVIYFAGLTNSAESSDWAFPIGITDYGITFINGSLFAYSYRTNEFIGIATINNAYTQEPNACPSGSVEPGSNWFSVEMNVIMVVKTTSGQVQYYWPQDIFSLNSLSNIAYVWDNIWNFSSYPSMLSNALISGNGAVYTSGKDHYYGYYLPTTHVSLPLTVYLIIKTGLSSSGYPWVAFGYSFNGQSINWYDNVTIKVPATAAYMEVSPTLNGRGLPNDAELVITGWRNYECTIAKSLNVDLALYFAWPYPSDKYLSPIPSMWDFGDDTGETIYDTYSVPIGYGEVEVLNGFEELGFLGRSYFIPLTIISPVSGTATSIYTVGSTVTLSEPQTVVLTPGETRYALINYVINNTLVVPSGVINLTLNGPTSVYVNYTLQYILTVEDPSGLLNGLSGWYNRGSVVTLSEPSIYNLGNETRLVFSGYDIYLFGSLYNVITNNTAELPMSYPYTIVVNWTRQYQVNVTSPVPITLSISSAQNLTGTTVSAWANLGSIVSVLIPRYYVLSNGTRLVYVGNNESITITSPLTIEIPPSRFERQYLITVTSPYPVNVNGTVAARTTVWVNEGAVITIKPATVFTGGLFMSEPGYTITATKPTSITVHWQVNWALTTALYGGLATAITAAIAAKARHKPRTSSQGQ
ncbi:thermopsin [Vulcanisaeta sp. JCM 14467]